MKPRLHSTPLRRVAASARLCLCALAALPVGGSAWAAESVVGQVSLLIGEARVVRADGSREALRRGAAIQVGDRVETSANGHVHVRFVDNAAVSVRPDSSLEVQAYRYDAQQPQSSEVRLRVEQGTSRSISGAATDVDKTRFRLNTPIAAIGVRGTDFIVQADSDGVRATVADGAIVVGALGGACSAAGLGPCAGGDARVLSADMGRMMAEVRPGDAAVRIVPASGSILNASAPGGGDKPGARAAEHAARTAGMLAAEPTQAAMLRGNDRGAAELLTIAAANVPELNRPGDPSAQLVWGRWSIAPVGDDRVSAPFSIASMSRHVTVADESAGLFRADDPSNPKRLLPGSLDAKADFRLSRASASFDAGGRSEAAVIEGGSLSIDFGQRSFATALAMSSASAGRAELRVGGEVRADGTFAVRDADQRVAGAVSLDGREAGYLFERGAAGGLFRGKTLWGR